MKSSFGLLILFTHSILVSCAVTKTKSGLREVEKQVNFDSKDDQNRVLSLAILNMSHYDDKRRPELTSDEAKHGIKIVIHRSGCGSGEVESTDWRYDDIKVQSDRLGCYLWGAYHFARPEKYATRNGIIQQAPVDQAHSFIRKVLQHRSPEKRNEKVLLCWDMEYFKDDKDQYMTPRAHALAIEEIKRITGHYPIIYAGHNFLLEKLLDAQLETYSRNVFGKCQLWVPRYGGKCPNIKGVNASPFKNWIIWQYCDPNKGGKPGPGQPSLIAGKPGEFNYIAMRRESITSWFEQNAWDYSLKGSLP